AARQRTVAGASQQRVEPDQLARAAPDARERAGQHLRLARVPAVAQYDDDRAPVHEPGPAGLEFRDARADARAAGPVPDAPGEPLQRPGVRAAAELPGHAAETRAEHERLDTSEPVLHGVQELEQEARVELH